MRAFLPTLTSALTGMGLAALLACGGGAPDAATPAAPIAHSDRLQTLDVAPRSVELRGGQCVTGPSAAVDADRPLADAVGDRPFVAAYWSVWCHVCVAEPELAHLRVLRDRLEARGATLVNVTLDELSNVTGHPNAQSWIYPVWHNPSGVLGLPPSLMRHAAFTLPLFVVVDAEREVQAFLGGPLDEAAVDALVAAASTDAVATK